VDRLGRYDVAVDVIAQLRHRLDFRIATIQYKTYRQGASTVWSSFFLVGVASTSAWVDVSCASMIRASRVRDLSLLRRREVECEEQTVRKLSERAAIFIEVSGMDKQSEYAKAPQAAAAMPKVR
jgi:hypothetical protein